MTPRSVLVCLTAALFTSFGLMAEECHDGYKRTLPPGWDVVLTEGLKPAGTERDASLSRWLASKHESTARLAKILLNDGTTAATLLERAALVLRESDHMRTVSRTEPTVTSGSVLLDTEVACDGSVRVIEVLRSSGNSAVDSAARKDVSESLYRPGKLNGKYVSTRIVVEVSLHP